jgi:hypothetical protein
VYSVVSFVTVVVGYGGKTVCSREACDREESREGTGISARNLKVMTV